MRNSICLDVSVITPKSLSDGKSYSTKRLADSAMKPIENLGIIRKQLPNGVNLLAVSKGHSSQSIRELAKKGQIDFGESRLQEALPKLSDLSNIKQIRWHFIGRLQSNKVRSVVRNFDFIHSVDSQVLAERISTIASQEKRSIKIMLQVKLAEDPTKGGLTPSELKKVMQSTLHLPNIKTTGLMTMAPFNFSLEERKTLFKECRSLANQLNLNDCSMGMSSDWKEALDAGATWLRLGSCIFGSRQK